MERARRRRDVLPAGKIPPDLLEDLLERTGPPDPSVLWGPGIGRDAAVVEPDPKHSLVLTSDPITFTTRETGHYLLAVNVNDIASMGGEARWLLLTLLLPPGTTRSDAEGLFLGIRDAARRFGVQLAGGHTEITDAVTRPVAIGALVGTVERERWINPRRAAPGDAILLTHGIAIEGTAILARERGAEIESALGKDVVRRALAYLEDPGICVRDPALLAAREFPVHAMHDPTEGGLATALRELGAVTGCGVRVDARRVPVLPETDAIARHLGLDPFGLIASGCLLIVLERRLARDLIRRMRESLGVPAGVIGELTREREFMWMDPRGREGPLPEFARDEIARLFQ